MGPFDREIIGYVNSKPDDVCQEFELIGYVSKFPDYDEDRAAYDIAMLVKDGLLSYDENSKEIKLTPKAKRPAVPIPPRQN